MPDDFSLQMTKMVDSNRYPIFNQQFIITNPETITNQEGFVYISVKDRFMTEALDSFHIPISGLKPFLPYNFEFTSGKQEYGNQKPKYFISVVIEIPNRESLIDQLADIAVHMVNFDPLPYANRMFVGMSINNSVPDRIDLINVDLSAGSNIAQAIQMNSNENKVSFLSTVLQIPPYQNDTMYKACAVFTIPKSYLEKTVQFFIVARDDSMPANHSMPNSVVGNTDIYKIYKIIFYICDQILKKLFFSPDKKQTFVPILWKSNSKLYPIFSTTKCTLDLGCFNQQSMKEDAMKNSQYSDKSRAQSQQVSKFMGQKSIIDEMSDKDKKSIIGRELLQKQEIVHRLLSELDSKGESLKITGAEIIDLRRQIKMLQSENAILRKKLAAEEQLEVQSIMSKEIAMMNTEELRTKILKLAQAYRDERIRNEDFEKSLKNSQKEIAQARQLQHEFEILQKKFGENTKKMLYLQNEVQKTVVYKETIKKQEKVIGKLEKLMEGTLKDTQKARQGQLELEQLRTENYQLQSKMKQGYGTDAEEGVYLKKEIIRLEKIIADLREEMQAKRPVSNHGDIWEVEKMEYEIKINKQNHRIEALQMEMTENTRNFAREIAQLKLIVAEKQALLDTLTLNI